MKTNIFYFSATGNSLAVARDIAAGLPDAQIYSIPQVIDGPIDLEADNIGIVFPVYFAGIPRIISQFIQKLDPGRIKYLFAVCTYGGAAIGALTETQEQLKALKIPLNAGYLVPMPGNYIAKYGAFSKARQEKMFRREKEAIRSIVRDIENQENRSVTGSNFLFNKIGKSFYHKMLPQFPTLDRHFNAGSKCDGCGICVRVCPVRNIKLAEQKPQWQGDCEHCMACIQWCPKEAIEYSTKSVGRKRYRHPEVSVKELIIRDEQI